jgi:ABC-2 type transport system permease protein
MSTTAALMRTELTLLRRDTTAWGTAVALPLLLGAAWVVNEPVIGDGLGAVVVLQVVGLLIFTLHTVGTMSLASRREQLVLKRWRSSQASATSVLIGTIGVPAGLVVAQAAALTAITALVYGQTPASVTMLGVGVLAGVVSVGAVTFVVAAFTRSAEHAMITTFPVIAVLMGATVWTLMRPLDAFDWPALAVPGSGAIQLLRLGWEGPSPAGDSFATWVTQAAPSLGATAVLTLLATATALRWFRWEPRG